VKATHESLGGKTDREAIVEILDRNGIIYKRPDDGALEMRSLVLEVGAGNVEGYTGFHAILAFDETETLVRVEVWE